MEREYTDYGISTRQFYKYRPDLIEPGVRHQKTRRHRTDQDSYEPTPEQIAAACAKIQKGWTPREKARRLGANICPWDVPLVVLPLDVRERLQYEY